MNPGAFIYEPALLDPAEVEDAARMARKVHEEKRPVHDGGRYGHIQWFQVDIDKNWPFARKMLEHIGAGDPELLVFYYLEPGAAIHPHRDLTGASLNNRIRFHIPVITNPDVDFCVTSERLQMNTGDLWCLDTSYRHSVHNRGNETRVHIVVECQITEQMKEKMPHGLKAKLHSLSYLLILGGAFIKAITINTFRDPAYLRAQLRMIGRYIRWRFLKTERAK